MMVSAQMASGQTNNPTVTPVVNQPQPVPQPVATSVPAVPAKGSSCLKIFLIVLVLFLVMMVVGGIIAWRVIGSGINKIRKEVLTKPENVKVLENLAAFPTITQWLNKLDPELIKKMLALPTGASLSGEWIKQLDPEKIKKLLNMPTGFPTLPPQLLKITPTPGKK